MFALSSARMAASLAMAFLVGLQFQHSYDLLTQTLSSEAVAGSRNKKAGDPISKLIAGDKHFQAVSGERFSIFCPFDDMMEDVEKSSPKLFSAPEEWLHNLAEHLDYLDSVVQKNDDRSIVERSRAVYLEALKNLVSGIVWGKEEVSVTPRKQLRITPLDIQKRKGGNDWTYLGYTMTGFDRLDNVMQLLQDIADNEVVGDYIETGVWRGGSSIFARGVIRAMNQGQRKSFVCDSFKGLPPGDRDLDRKDKNWDKWPYLEVSAELVAGNFNSAGLLDSQVIFVKGFFNDTMPVLSPMINALAVMRLDGDMYESTVDVLYHLYEKLSVGGYVIMDDWFGFPSRTACEDFFKVHGISPEIIQIDSLAVYWKKTEEIRVQYWRYEQLQFKMEA